MAVVFFDTSAPVQRYARSESGADRVLELCDPSIGNLLMLAALASVEVASALNRKGSLGAPHGGRTC